MKTYLLMMRKAFLIGSVFLLFFATSALGATYYVATTGSDSNPGTEGRPWLTIQKAANTVDPGDTVIVKDGTYTDTNSDGRVVYLKRGGTSSNWITFRSENYLGAVIDGRNVVSSTGFYINNSAYVRLEGFDIKRPVHGMLVTGTSHDIYVYKVRFRDIGRAFKETRSCSTSGYTASRLHNGINTRDESYNITIDRCIFNNIGKLHRTPPCKFDYVYEHAVYARGKGWLIQNNIFYDIHSGWAIKCDGHDGRTSNPTHKIINNTFARGHDGYPSPYPDGYGFILVTQGHGDVPPHHVIIQNNIFYDVPGNEKYTIRDNSKMDKNCIVRNNVTSAAVMDNRMAATYSKNVSGVALAKFGMRDPDNKDFTLTDSASYLINRGIATLAPDKDQVGIARPQDAVYDIGAYEYVPSDHLLAAPQALKFVSQ